MFLRGDSMMSPMCLRVSLWAGEQQRGRGGWPVKGFLHGESVGGGEV